MGRTAQSSQATGLPFTAAFTICLQLGVPQATAAGLGHGCQPYRDIGGAVAGIAVLALDDFKEEAPFERLGVDVKQFTALGISVVQHVEISQLAEKLIIEIETRREVLVLVERNVHQRHAGLFGAADLGKDVIAVEGDVVHAGAAITGQRMGDRGVTVLGNIER